VRRVIVPPHPGNFSALGLLSTDLVYYDSRSAYVPLVPEAAPQIEAVFEEMERSLRERAGVADGEAAVRRSFDGRLFGQSWETPFVEVPEGPITPETIPSLVERFHAAYERRYGNRFPYVPVQGVSYRVELIVHSEKVDLSPHAEGAWTDAKPKGTIEIRYFDSEPLQAAEYDRVSLPVGSRIAGPAVIREGLSTTFVVPGQTVEVGAVGELVIEQERQA
jgi:N-methylhydantoinase A